MQPGLFISTCPLPATRLHVPSRCRLTDACPPVRSVPLGKYWGTADALPLQRPAPPGTQTQVAGPPAAPPPQAAGGQGGRGRRDEGGGAGAGPLGLDAWRAYLQVRETRGLCGVL